MKLKIKTYCQINFIHIHNQLFFSETNSFKHFYKKTLRPQVNQLAIIPFSVWLSLLYYIDENTDKADTTTWHFCQKQKPMPKRELQISIGTMLSILLVSLPYNKGEWSLVECGNWYRILLFFAFEYHKRTVHLFSKI